MKPSIEEARELTETPCLVTSAGNFGSARATRFCTRTILMSRSAPTAKVTVKV